MSYFGCLYHSLLCTIDLFVQLTTMSFFEHQLHDTFLNYNFSLIVYIVCRELKSCSEASPEMLSCIAQISNGTVTENIPIVCLEINI